MSESSLSQKNSGLRLGFDCQDILDHAPIGFFTSTPEGRYISVNPALARMYGYDSPEALIASITNIAAQVYADPEDRKEFIRLLEEHGEVVNHECRLRRRDRTEFWGSSNARVVRDQGGRIVDYQGFTADISKGKYLQEELEQRLVEIRKSKTAFKKEELRRRILMDNSLDGIAIIDQNHRVLDANKSFAQMLGYTQEEVLGLRTWDWEARQTEEQIRASFSDLAAIKTIFETRHQRKDGSTFDVEVSATGVEIADQNVIMAVCRDITERKRAEEEQARSREMLLQAEVLAKLGCLEWDIPCDAWFVSDNWRCIMGHHAPRLSSSELFAYVHPEDRWRVKRAVASTMRTGEPYAIQHRILRGDTGEVRHVQTYGVVELNKSGKPVRGFGAVLDITERKLAEEALQESEARFRNLLEQVPTVAVQGYGMDGVTQYWNQASEKIYGYCSEEAVGKNLVDLIIPDEMRLEVVEAIKMMSETGVPIPTAELNLKRKDGSRVPVYSSHAIVQKPGSSPELFCIDVDLTELKQTEQALLQAKEQAEAANKAKSEFLANMSHEIRTPINGIMGMMQLLETTHLDADQRQYVQLCTSSADRLTRLLADILDLSRVEAGRMELCEDEFSIEDLRDSVSSLFNFTARSKGVALKCSIDPSLPLKLLGDDARVRQVLFNLVGNALKFTDRGKVDVEMFPLSSRWEGDLRVLFSVVDTGIGIPEDRLKDIFEPFRQVDGSYTRKYQGAGLGLSIVRRLVELMGGSISMESAPGEGTVVHVALPFKLSGSVSPVMEQETSGLAESKQSLRILLAEDEPSNSLPIMKLLEKAGHTVTLAEDGQQVLDLLKVHDFDCILMDVQMPVLNGVETTRRIRQMMTDECARMKTETSCDSFITHHSSFRIPIIALTAYAMTGDREKFLEAGMNYFLAKPVRMENLEKVLDKILITEL